MHSDTKWEISHKKVDPILGGRAPAVPLPLDPPVISYDQMKGYKF